jgi:hypothetical protein
VIGVLLVMLVHWLLCSSYQAEGTAESSPMLGFHSYTNIICKNVGSDIDLHTIRLNALSLH